MRKKITASTLFFAAMMLIFIALSFAYMVAYEVTSKERDGLRVNLERCIEMVNRR